MTDPCEFFDPQDPECCECEDRPVAVELELELVTHADYGMGWVHLPTVEYLHPITMDLIHSAALEANFLRDVVDLLDRRDRPCRCPTPV